MLVGVGMDECKAVNESRLDQCRWCMKRRQTVEVASNYSGKININRLQNSGYLSRMFGFGRCERSHPFKNGGFPRYAKRSEVNVDDANISSATSKRCTIETKQSVLRRNKNDISRFHPGSEDKSFSVVVALMSNGMEFWVGRCEMFAEELLRLGSRFL